jgi:phosphate transport system substrate-binding protein
MFARLRLLILLLPTAIVPSVAAQEAIVVDGSSGMVPLAKALAAVYQEKTPIAKVEVGKGIPPKVRLPYLAEGKIHVALASRMPKPDDLQAGKLKAIEVAKGAIVFAVNASVPISNITESQLCDVYSGKTRSWQSFGGPDTPIVVLTRPPTESDPEVIRARITCFGDLKEPDSAKVMARSGDMEKALAETPHAIGITSMTVVEQSGGKVKALTLNGVAATPANVKNGRYFVTRDYLFIVAAQPRPAVKNFLDFVLSTRGDQVILENGAVPMR